MQQLHRGKISCLKQLLKELSMTDRTITIILPLLGYNKRGDDYYMVTNLEIAYTNSYSLIKKVGDVMTTNTRIPNRLAKEKSPYLLQHAHNPVDWFPWGDEAFNKAKSEDKPIFLSIGYS